MENPFQTVRTPVDLAGEVSDEVRKTTCYMCACRCGIDVHLKDGRVRYIEGNRDHPVNRGVLCAKGSAGIMNHYSPARLTKPLLRVGERGEGKFREIEWEEALGLATQWLSEVRYRDPDRLAFFTGRDQSQSLTGWWAAQFGTVNFAAHGGFCSVNMAAAGLYTLGGAFWEFGEPDWERTRIFMLFGVAEDHESNPIKAGLGTLKTRGDARIISVNPVRTGYSAIADDWVAIRPGTDGLFVAALIRELLLADKVDWDYLVRYTNAHWLVIDDPGAADDGLFARDASGAPLCFDRATASLRPAALPDISPVLAGARTLPDGRSAVPAFELLSRRFLDPQYDPDAVSEATGVPADQIRRIAADLAEAAFEQEIRLPIAWTDWAGREHREVIGRPVSMHAMRGISAHSNGFHTCRMIHVLQVLLGSVDVPGGWRYKPPFPKAIPAGPRPAKPAGEAGKPLSGMPLGNPAGPEDLLVDADGRPQRLDKAYSWEHPLAAHGLMHMVLHNAWAGDPHPVDVLFMFMANMSWNSAMNVGGTLRYLTDKGADGEYRIPKIIYADAYWSEMVSYADLVLPDTTYLERWDAVSLLDRPISRAEGPADAIRQPVVAPDRDVRPFQDVLIDLGYRLGLPGMTNEDGSAKYPGGYADYLVNHLRGPELGPLAGWRGADGTQSGRGAVNPGQLDRYVENGCFWQATFPEEMQYLKHANRTYLEHAHAMGWLTAAEPVVLQLYSETLQSFRRAARGHGDIQPPERERARVERYFDPLPFWYTPFEEEAADGDAFPLHAVTQRPPHMYHSWGSQNAWLRQITAENRLYMHRDAGTALGLADDDWVWVESPHGRVKGQVRLVTGVNRHTVWTWNAIGKRRGAWGLHRKAPEAERGFLLNHVISDLLPAREGGYRYANADPVTGQAAWYDLRVRVEKCTAAEAGAPDPDHPPLPRGPGGGAGAPFSRREKGRGRGTDRKPAAQPHERGASSLSPTSLPGGERPEAKDWLAHREVLAKTVPGIRPGRGNETEGETEGET